jgi:hypothetical protein
MILVVPLVWTALLVQGPATVSLSRTVVGLDGQPMVGADRFLASMPVDNSPILERTADPVGQDPITVRFVVRDEMGKPVAGATIRAQSSSGMIAETTNGRGEFRIAGVAPGSEVTIEAHRHERTTDGPVKVVAGGTEPLIVTIVPGLTVAAVGRVLGPGGAPVSGALVKLQFRKEPSKNEDVVGEILFPEKVQFDDDVEVSTDKDGAFQTPKELYRKARQFHAEVTADGFLPKQTDWISPPAGELVTFPDLTLRQSRTLRLVSGRVVDREGRGVAGVWVFQVGFASMPTETTTDSAGRFQLAEVPNREAFVFAEKGGFRFGGAMVGPGNDRADIRLARENERPLSIVKSLPAPRTRAAERALAKELLTPLVAAARSPSAHFMIDSVMSALARVDPERVLTMLENRVLFRPETVLIQVALGQLEDDPAAAMATMEADRNPKTRAEGFLLLSDAGPDSDRARRIELIDRALDAARRVDDKDTRLRILGHVANRWLDLDLSERAKPILQEGRAIMAALPAGEYFPGLEEFAEALAVFDLATARSIFERRNRIDLRPSPNSRSPEHHLGEAAVRLAAIDPAGAERLLPNFVPNGDRTPFVLRVCQRMARTDLTRARKVLDTIDKPIGRAPFRRLTLPPYGLALMAAELAATDPDRAKRLLDEAFAGFQEIARDGDNREVSCVMAAILPLVEWIEPERLPERLWLTLASRGPLDEPLDLDAIETRVVLAMFLSRYDRAMAAAVIAPALERLPELLTETLANRDAFNLRNRPVVAALAVYDPRAVVALIQALPESARTDHDKKGNWSASGMDVQIRLAAAETLGLPAVERCQTQILWGLQLPRYRRLH